MLPSHGIVFPNKKTTIVIAIVRAKDMPTPQAVYPAFQHNNPTQHFLSGSERTPLFGSDIEPVIDRAAYDKFCNACIQIFSNIDTEKRRFL